MDGGNSGSRARRPSKEYNEVGVEDSKTYPLAPSPAGKRNQSEIRRYRESAGTYPLHRKTKRSQIHSVNAQHFFLMMNRRAISREQTHSRRCSVGSRCGRELRKIAKTNPSCPFRSFAKPQDDRSRCSRSIT